jgi:DNA-binding beta-propeller fold protein YncE
MKRTIGTLIATALVSAAWTAPTLAQGLTEAWRIQGFVAPESVSYDPGTNSLFVSNVNSPDFSANGQGYVTQLALDGTIMAEKFVEGLNAPKGTFVADGTLYVAGVNELVEIDIASATITARYAAANAPFLNDVVVADDGRVFVAETATNSIYVLENGVLSQWLTGAEQLAGANGLVIDGGALLVARLGDISRGFENMQPANIKSVDLATKAITDYGSAAPIGGLDGIELYDGAVAVTDNPTGRLLEVARDGTVSELATPGAGAADFEYIPAERLFVVPVLNTGEIVAYREAP